MALMTVDEIYDVIGNFGYAQIKYISILAVIQIFISIHMLMNIYTGLEPPFICYIHSGNGSTYIESCSKDSTFKCDYEFIGNHSSISSEWNLVCNEKFKVAMAQSIWMGGVMAGALFLSRFSDKIGRLMSLLLSLIGVTLFDGFAAFSQSYQMLVILRFIGGMCCSLVILTSFVLAQELVGGRRRSLCSVISSWFFSIGIGILSAMAFYFRGWRTLMFTASLSGVIFIGLLFFVPESPRWLIGKGRFKEAKIIIEIMAAKNGKLHLMPKQWSFADCNEKGMQRHQGVSSLFNHRYLLVITLIQIYSWFVNSAVYYALTMSAGNLHGNVYWATTINGLVEIPACTSTIFIIERYGRRCALCVFMIGGGIVCMLINFVPTPVGQIFALIGKLGISASFSIIYLHSGEIFPTVIRNSALGIVSVAARVGGIVSPLILMIGGDAYPNLHFLVLGAMTLLAGILNSFLPETLGRPMPETIADIIALQDKDADGNSKCRRLRALLSNKDGYKRVKQTTDEEETDI